MSDYDALLLVSFGGPEGRDDVLPFLRNVLRGRNVPERRMLEVAEHYYHFDGVSPINAQNRALLAALEVELAEHGPPLRLYWGNRNWHPLLPEAIRQMQRDGVRRALAFMTSAFSSYSGCRQYRENVADALRQCGAADMQVDKLRMFYNHPGFVQPQAERVGEARGQIPTERRGQAELIFTAHSLPAGMAAGCDYVRQLQESCRLVVEQLGPGVRPAHWQLCYQSRSGPPSQPWLEPDICDVLERLADEGRARDVVVCPIGFISDHMEVLFDLDTEAQQLCQRRGLHMVRAQTVGTHLRFVHMIGELIRERTEGAPRLALGSLGPSHDVCPEDCCLSGRPAAAS